MSELVEKILLEGINTGIAALKFWTNGGHDIINAIHSNDKKTKEKYKNMQKVFSINFHKEGPMQYKEFVKFIAKLKPYTGEIYRGIIIKQTQLKSFLSKYAKNKTITFPFASATKNYTVGERFAAGSMINKSIGCLFKIQSKTARDISRYADKTFKWQEEVVILDNSTYKVTNIIKPSMKWSRFNTGREKSWLNPIIIELEEQ